MGIKTYKAYTPSRRNMTGSDFAEVTKTTPERSLLAGKKKTAGRNNQGKITVRHHGGGNRQKYRIIDFKRNSKDGIQATVIGIEYDPNRSANIALICYADGEKAYILAPAGLTDGMKVMSGEAAEARVGNCLPLSRFRSAQMYTTLSCFRARADRWYALQETPHSLWQRKAIMRRSDFRPVRCAWFRLSAAQRSALSETASIT